VALIGFVSISGLFAEPEEFDRSGAAAEDSTFDHTLNLYDLFFMNLGFAFRI